MAISARSASLQSQRNPYASRRILSPTSTAINTIARKTATAELGIMTDKYNAGMISNEDFRNFLTKQMSNIGISESDKAEIEIKIKDFDSLVRKDQLEAAYKMAPENSLAKVSAATAISNFYKDRAASMAAGTPAQSQAMENAGQWEQSAISIQNTVEKQARTNYRYIQEQKINQSPSGSSDQAYGKAQMYQQMAEQAAQDGDQMEANRFMAQAQQYSTLGDQYLAKEGDRSIREQRTAVLDYLNGAINAYHDGQLDANGYYQVLREVDAYALENGDTSLQLKVNSESDRIAKLEAKGGPKRGSVGGLPVILGKGKGGAGGGGTDWDDRDYKYSNDLRAFDAEYKAGLSNPQEYAESIGEVLTQRQQDIVTRLETAEALAEQNPNAKITFNGKKTRAADVVEALYKEMDDLDGQVDAYNKGNFTLMEIPPDQFNKSGTFKKSGKNVATYQLVDLAAIPPEAMDNYMMDEDGILHQVLGEYLQLSPDQAQYVSNGYYTDPETGQSYKVTTDPNTGLATIRINSRVDLYDPTDRTKKLSLTLEDGMETIPGYEKAFQQQEQKLQDEAKQAQVAEAKALQDSATKVPDLRMMNQRVQDTIKPITDKVGNVVNSVAQKIPEPIKETVKKAPFEAALDVVAPDAMPAIRDKASQIQGAVQGAVNNISNVVAPAMPKVQEAVRQSPINYMMNTVNAPVVSANPNSGSKPITKVMNGVNQVKQYDPVKGFTYQPVKAPQVQAPPKQTALQSIATKVAPVIKQSPFDFLKKKLGF